MEFATIEDQHGFSFIGYKAHRTLHDALEYARAHSEVRNVLIKDFRYDNSAIVYVYRSDFNLLEISSVNTYEAL